MAYQDYVNTREHKAQAQREKILSGMPSFVVPFFDSLKDKGLSESSLLIYAYDLLVFFRHLQECDQVSCEDMKSLSLDTFDRISADDLSAFLKETDYSDGGKAHMVTTLRSFYTYFNSTGALKTNPAMLLVRPAPKAKELTILNRAEISMLLEAALSADISGKPLHKRRRMTRSRDYAILVVLIGTGIRVSELVGLNLSDVDINNNCLYIARKEPLSNCIYFGEEVRDAISYYWIHDRNALEPDELSEDALFISYTHGRITPRSVENLVQKYSKKADIEKNVTPHVLRATFGMHLYEVSGDIQLVASSLGYSSVATLRMEYKVFRDVDHPLLAHTSSSIFPTNKNQMRKL